jgi:NADH:ubiquinone oxidoreductase subunit 3 (subunit A)
VTTPLWYVVGFGFAGVTFVLLTIMLACLLSHRSKGDRHKGLPYESGIDTYG